MDLQYYLENGFVLYRKEAERSKNITGHKLELGKKITTEEIEFPDGIPGKPEAVEEPLGVLDMINFTYLIKIRFENEPRICLTFSSTLWKGGYILKKSFMLYEIDYNGKTYQCDDWDRPHFLLVCMRSIKEMETKRRTAPGVKFDSPTSR